jgi:DNA-binding LacI/PurR family transcriptional regulator
MASNGSPVSKKRPVRPASKPILSISDFAKYLGLSNWTVSRAINGHPEVKEKTRRRIMAAMDEVGFRPNPLARGLGGRRTSMVGVCFMGLGNPILDQKVFHLQEFLRRNQLRSLLEMRQRDVQHEIHAIEDFQRIRVEGVVLLYSELDAATAAQMFSGLACVQVDPHYSQTIPSVALDRRRAMRLVLEHLIRLGHENFALLGFNKADPWRWPALLETAKSHGLDPDRSLRIVEKIPQVTSPIESGGLMVEEVLRWPRRPTAIVAIDDRTALGAIQALRTAGIDVPRQMSVTGFDNLDFARHLHPTLTTIDQSPLRLMERAGAILLEQIKLPPEKRGRAQPEFIAPELVVGESTGPA